MKKCLLVIVSIILALSLCGCKSTSVEENNNSSAPTNESTYPLFYDISVIENFEIWHGYELDSTLITEKEDLEFLKEYKYAYTIFEEELDEVFAFTKTNILKFEFNGLERNLYITKDGNIFEKVISGDSEVEEVEFNVFKAEGNYCLNEQRFVELLKKYDNEVVGWK